MNPSYPHCATCGLHRRSPGRILSLLAGALLVFGGAASAQPAIPFHPTDDGLLILKTDVVTISGAASDCNNNGIPDNEDIAQGTSTDCNFNAIPDECEKLPDCNGNRIPDLCDILDGTSGDCNGNGIPDECDLRGLAIINQSPADGISGVFGDVDIVFGHPPNTAAESFRLTSSFFLNAFTERGIYYPGNDASNTSFTIHIRADNAGNPGSILSTQLGVVPTLTPTGSILFGNTEYSLHFAIAGLLLSPGIYWIETFETNPNNSSYVWMTAPTDPVTGDPGSRQGSNQNAPGSAWSALPDSLALIIGTAATSTDCNANGVPDECEDLPDCNGNRIPDACDIASGTSTDCNANGIPDECENLPDCDGNRIPDACDLRSSLIINQSPADGLDGRFGDINVLGALSTAAESFKLTSPYLLATFTELGIYFPGNDASNTMFSIYIRADNGGNPGSILHSAFGVAPTLTPTGNFPFGFTEYRLAFTIPGILLPPGTYWLETFEVNPNNGSYVWLTAPTDSSSGDPGSRHALQLAPGSLWEPVDGSLSLIIGAPATSADCNRNGIPDDCEGLPDCNDNDIPDVCDIAAGRNKDCNGNGIPDECENLPDCNHNGVPDVCDIINGRSEDCNLNGIPDECESLTDCNADGIPDVCQKSIDCNNNSIPDECENLPDLNNNGIPDECDIATGFSQDCNNNGVPDESDVARRIVIDQWDDDGWVWGMYSDVGYGAIAVPYSATESFHLTAPYSLNAFSMIGFYPIDGYAPNNITFSVFVRADDGTGNPGTVLLSSYGVAPAYTTLPSAAWWWYFAGFNWQAHKLDFTFPAIALPAGKYWIEVQEDNNTNPDFLWASAPTDPISGDPGALSSTGIAPASAWSGLSSSLALRISAAATSSDCNLNGVPDECENLHDCNNNDIPDVCDIAGGRSTDCNLNGIPDECEGLPDCNDNDIPDICEIANGTVPDCNGNGVPDQCDLLLGTSNDCDNDGIPDECEGLPDCNENGVPDSCEIASGEGTDCNGNGILDECDIRAGTSSDCNGNGLPDECDINGSVIINQSPRTGNTATYADINNGLANSNSNSAAESFRIAFTSAINSFTELGCYLFSNNSANTSFDIYIRKDDGFGHPGTIVHTQIGAVPTLTPTGGSFAGVPVYNVRFALTSSVTLPPGKFWIETIEKNPSNDRYGWVAATTDPVSGDPGHLTAQGSGPGFTWSAGGSSLGLIIRAAPTSADCNENGIPDECERLPDCNNNGIPDECEIADGKSQDCNGNDIPDECEIATGTLHDCNGDGIADECQGFEDCNNNGVPDECDIRGLTVINQSPPDGITGVFGDISVWFGNFPNSAAESFRLTSPFFLNNLTEWGIYYPGGDASNTSFSINIRANNGGNPGSILFSQTGVVPTLTSTGNTHFGSAEYKLHFAISGVFLPPGTYWIETLEENPANSSYVWLSAPTDPSSGDPGSRQLNQSASGTGWGALSYSLALSIGTPATSTDCNGNGIPDECETLPDCNRNGIPDACDIASGKSTDCNDNRIPDECENLPDCNKNGIPDACDIASGASNDYNGNGIPDECEGLPDCNDNGIPDEFDLLDSRILNQSPADGVDGRFSDAAAFGSPSAAAENFHLASPYVLSVFSGLGIYFPSGDHSNTAFSIYIRADNAGNPGTILYSQTGVVPTLAPTGNLRFGQTEYRIGFTIPTLSLPAGTYWMETVEENIANDGYVWLSAATDPTSGNPGSAHALQAAPGSVWSNPGFSLALTIGSPARSADCNRNGIPDECEQFQDCNDNDMADACEIADGITPDCNGNGIPDLCDILLDTSEDCNRNGIPDECDISSGSSSDCNGNGIPDECDILGSPVILNQGSKIEYASYFSDVTANGGSFMAESFRLTSTYYLDKFSVLGTYYPSNNTSGSVFNVFIRADIGSALPGPFILHSEFGVAPVATPAGTVGGQILYKLEFVLAGASLPPGKYWLELIEVNPSNSTFYWQAAHADPIAGDPGSAGTQPVAQGPFWFANSYSLALVIGAPGTSADCDGNRIPDECETLPDCNGNGSPDACDIAEGTSRDLDGDGIPDECQTTNQDVWIVK